MEQFKKKLAAYREEIEQHKQRADEADEARKAAEEEKDRVRKLEGFILALYQP